jgi:AraC family transcriptional regulator of arabinose operon
MPGTVIWPEDPRIGPHLRISGIGIHDQMPRMIVDRPQGTMDYLFMHFHSPSRVYLQGKMQDLAAHTLVVWSPGQRHTFGHPDRSWSHSWLHCDGPAVHEALATVDLPFDRPLLFQDAYLVERWLLPILDELARCVRPDAIILESLITIWVRELHRSIEGGPGLLPQRLRDVLRLMEGDLKHAWTLTDLARAANLSVSRFSSEFRQHLGGSPMDFLLRLRLRRAVHELRNQELSISEIAERVGFRDAFYFSRQFKRHHGSSPRHYRQRALALLA